MGCQVHDRSKVELFLELFMLFGGKSSSVIVVRYM